MDYSNENTTSRDADVAVDYLTDRLDINLVRFRKLLGTSPDIVIRELIINAEVDQNAAIIYLENLVDKNRINEDILRPLTANAAQGLMARQTPNCDNDEQQPDILFGVDDSSLRKCHSFYSIISKIV
jgi:hypothetical protein